MRAIKPFKLLTRRNRSQRCIGDKHLLRRTAKRRVEMMMGSGSACRDHGIYKYVYISLYL